jgi:hypothetical protein
MYVISVRDRHGAEQAVNGISVWCKLQEEDRGLVYGEVIVEGGIKEKISRHQSFMQLLTVRK